MAFARSIVILLALLIPFTASAASLDKITALKELEELNIPFTPEDFLDRVTERDVVAVQLFLMAGMDPGTREDNNDSTALMLAAGQGHSNIVSILVDAGANVNALSKSGDTALCLAAFPGDMGTIEILLDSGAKIDGPKNPLLNCSPLVTVARQGRTDVVISLLERGADTGGRSREALVNAAEHGDFQMVAALLDKGADANFESRGDTALMFAAWRGDVEMVWLLLDNGAKANAVGSQGMTAFFQAVGSIATLREKTEIITLLRNNGADANAGMGHGRKPIHIAVRDIDVTRILLDNGADANAVDVFGEVPLMYAARHDNIDVAVELLKHGADIQATNKEGETALTIAQEKGHVEIEKLLQDPDSAREKAWQYKKTGRKKERRLKIRGEPEIAQSVKKKLAEMSEDVLKKTRRPIIKGDSDSARSARKKLAEQNIPFNRDEFVKRAGENDISPVRLFLAAGMNPNARGKENRQRPAIVAAAESGSLEIAKLLLSEGADPNLSLNPWPREAMTLLYAANGGHVEIVRLLLENGAKVDTKDTHGITPLMAAAMRGDREIVELLLAKDADVNLRMDGKWGDGSTALMNAVWRGDIEIVRALLDRGADVNIPENNETALMKAAERGHTEIVKILLDKGANIHAKDYYGKTALHEAARDARAEVAEILLGKGADVNVGDVEGRTSLMAAVEKLHKDFAGLLLEWGADVNVRDYDGETALMHAASNGDTEMVEFLIENGADVNAEDNSGATALSRASFKRHAEIVELFEQAGAVEPEIQTANETGAKLLGSATRVGFSPHAENWDEDPEADGAGISISLGGKRHKTVDFEGIELSVEIRIYSATERKNRDEIEGRLIYDGTHTVSSREDMIRIPYEDIKELAADEDYWAIDVIVTLPDGRTIEQKSTLGSSIRPDRLMKKVPAQ